MPAALGALAVAAADQGIKAVVAALLPPSSSVALIPGVLSLTHVHNTGVAFGLLGGVSPVATSLAALTLLFLLIYNRGRWHESRAGAAGVALVAGGAVGNLLDRMRLGHVVDYIDVHVWPVFNLADAAIVIGAAVLLVAHAREDRSGRPRR